MLPNYNFPFLNQIAFTFQHQQNSSEGLAKREATLRRLVEILDLAAEEGCGLSFDEVPMTANKKDAFVFGKKSLPKMVRGKPR